MLCISFFCFTFVNAKKNEAKCHLTLKSIRKMKDRIKQIIESLNMSQQEFANFVEISPASLSGIFNDRTRPTLNMVEAIKKKIQNLNTDWLMFGSGEMYVDSKSPTPADGDADGNGAVSHNALSGDPTPQQRNISGAEMTLDFDGGGYSSPAPATQQSRMSMENQHSARTNSNGVRNTPNNRIQEIQKKVDISQRHITEIRIYFDDQTFETFVPAKK